MKVEDLQKGSQRVLFIYGSKESESTRTRISALLKLLPGAKEKIVDGDDHVTTLPNPTFGAAIVEFLRALKSN